MAIKDTSDYVDDLEVGEELALIGRRADLSKCTEKDTPGIHQTGTKDTPNMG